jgi:hypothetical protein
MNKRNERDMQRDIITEILLRATVMFELSITVVAQLQSLRYE